jgi:hypothetical protein
MVELEQMLLAYLRGEGILCHSRPRLSIGYSLDLDSEITLTWPMVRAILQGLPDPDATVKDWIFFAETGEYRFEDVLFGFGMLKGAYAVRARLVKRFRFETKDEQPWTVEVRLRFQDAWQRALNQLVTFLQS